MIDLRIHEVVWTLVVNIEFLVQWLGNILSGFFTSSTVINFHNLFIFAAYSFGIGIKENVILFGDTVLFSNKTSIDSAVTEADET